MNWGKVNQLLAVGDLNDDGLPDLVTEEAGGNLYALYTSGSSSTLTSIQLLGTNPAWDNWTFISPGNTTGDGGVAQLWARDTTGQLWNLNLTYNSTTGTDSLGTPIAIDPGTLYPASSYPQILSLGDLNQDGHPDLLATTSDGALQQITNTSTTSTPDFSGTPGGAQIQAPGWATTATAIDSNAAPLPDSGPLTLTVGDGTLCMDDAAGNQTPGTAIWDYACNGTPPQQWTFQPDGTIHAQNSNACLTTTTTGNDQPITLQNCVVGDTLQQWKIQDNTDCHALQNATATDADSKPVCLADPAANPAPETPLITWTCETSDSQSFALPNTGPTGHWALNDPSTSTTANNTAAQNPASAIGGTVTFGSTGLSAPATAATFNGSDILHAATAINATQSYTVSAWVKLTPGTSQQWALAEGDTNHAAIYLGYNGTNWQFMTTTSDTPTTTYAFAAGGPPPLQAGPTSPAPTTPPPAPSTSTSTACTRQPPPTPPPSPAATSPSAAPCAPAPAPPPTTTSPAPSPMSRPTTEP